MCARCAERRARLVEAGRAVLRADARTAAQGAQHVGRTLAQDARTLALRLARRP